MIDIKELHVGAHVEFNKERVKVHGIDVANEENLPVIISTSLAAVEPNEIDPIPITAALLDELGFEPIRKTLGKHDEEWHMELDGYLIRVMRGESNTPEREWSVHIDSWDYDVFGVADVAYLHQLEDFVYLCTGKEIIKDEE